MKTKLNPWHIEIDRLNFKERIALFIVNSVTGERRMVELTVDDINEIIEAKDLKDDTRSI